MRRSLGAALAVATFAFAGVATAQQGLSEPDPSSAYIAPVSDPDPAGGPPWGMRVYRTRDGGTCHQLGRVQDGKLGSVDENGTFTEAPLRGNGCGGPPRPGQPPRPYGVGHTGLAAFETPAGVRSVYYGHFSPLLKRVTFADPDGTDMREIQVSPDGEYVAVFPDWVPLGGGPRQRLYFDGGCGPERKDLMALSTRSEVVNCQVVIPLDEPRAQRESAASRRARRNPSRPSPVTVTPKVAGPGRRITAHFKVPITVQPGEAYIARVSGEGARKCADKLAGQRGVTGVASFRTQVRGRWDDIGLPLGGKSGRWCRGTYTVEVSFRDTKKQYKPFGSATFRIK